MAEPYIELIVLGLSADKIFDFFYGLEYSDFTRSSIDPLLHLEIYPEFHRMSISDYGAALYSDPFPDSFSDSYSFDEFGSLVSILFIDTPDGTAVRFVPAYNVYVDDAIAELIFRILEKLFQWTRVKMVKTSLDSWDYFDDFNPRTLDDILKLKPKFTEPPDEKITSNENKERYPWDQLDISDRNKKVLKYWHEGKTNNQIGAIDGREKKTISNVISTLRKKYGEDIVITHDERKRRGIV